MAAAQKEEKQSLVVQPTPKLLQPELLINTGKSWFWVIRNYTPDFYSAIKDLPALEDPPIFVFGKWARQQRDVAFFSDESKGYAYSTTFIPSTPLAVSPVIQWLLPALNQALGTSFNGVLYNRYKNGTKYVSAHPDEESALDKKLRLVVGIAYGPGVRTFRIRDRKTKKIVYDFVHEPCCLYGMQGEFQSVYTHEIPVQKKVKGERISLTFRHHLE